MAISFTHTFVSAIPDGADATIVRPSNWNAEHTVTMATGKLLGRTTAGTGAIQEITPSGGLTLSAGGITLSAQASYTGFVATRARAPVNFNAGNKQMMSRTWHIMREDVTSFQLVYPNWYVTGGTGETAAGATATYKASIESAAGTILATVLFSGSATGTVTSGSNLISDAISLTIARGTPFYVRTWYSSTAGIIYNYQAVSAATVGESATFGVTTPDLTGSGGALAGGDASNCQVPLAIIGSTTRTSCVFYGDSNGAGTGDTMDDQTGDIGAIARSVGPWYAYGNCSAGGETAQSFSANSTRRIALAQYASHAIVQLGRNDITAARTAAQVLANLSTIKGLLTIPTYVTTIGPFNASTDTWLTTDNQTVEATNAARLTTNQTLRAAPYGYAGCFDTSNALESQWDIGKWTVATTADGVHPALYGTTRVKMSGVVDAALMVRR